MKSKLLVLAAFFVAIPNIVGAACIGSSPNWTCASVCTDSELQSCFDSANSGDTINIPPGTHSFAKGTGISGKSLKIKGAGQGLTIIKADNASQAIMGITIPSSGWVSLSDLTIDCNSSTASNGVIGFGSVVFGSGKLEISNVTCDNSVQPCFSISGQPFGVIHSSTFNTKPGQWGQHVIRITGGWGGVDAKRQWDSWKADSSLGTGNALFIEDCIFNFPEDVRNDIAIDAYGGARYVLRYNTFVNCYTGHHGMDSGGYLSPILFEWYNNKYTSTSNMKAPWAVGVIRGGTGVIHDNTYASTYVGKGIILQNFRSCCSGNYPCSHWKGCGEGQYKLCSNLNLDGNVVIGGYMVACNVDADCGVVAGVCNRMFCSNNPDILCTEGDNSPCGSGTCTRYLDGEGTNGYPCRDQIGRGSNQVLQPLYAWNNMAGSYSVPLWVDSDSDCAGRTGNIIQRGRDFYDNTSLSGYTTFTYPHPLRSTVQPPKDLRIVR